MPYLVLDTETTGLPDWRLPADAEGQPRLASWCFLFVDDDLEIEERRYELVRPDGWTMPDAAAAVNGLTQERLIAEGHDVALALHLLNGAIAEGRTLVAHNLQFDTKIMRGEFRRAGYDDAARCSGGICTMRALTQACGLPKPTGNGLKFPRLAEACLVLLGRDLPGAHNALIDAKACLWLLRVMRERGLLFDVAA